MSQENKNPQKSDQAASQKQNATKALKEAADRRKKFDEELNAAPTEKGGRGGKDPARYGDWEVKGIASDF